jgi:hypothetical protein
MTAAEAQAMVTWMAIPFLGCAVDGAKPTGARIAGERGFLMLLASWIGDVGGTFAIERAWERRAPLSRVGAR